MGKLLLSAAALVGAVAILGMTIDIQSRTPIVRPNRSAEPSFIFASGRIEGVTSEIELRPQLARMVVERGWQLLELKSQEFTLEEVFINLVTEETTEEKS